MTYEQYNPDLISFYVFIQRSNNEQLFRQISTIFRQLKRMTMQTQISCTIQQKQTIKRMTCRANNTIQRYDLKSSYV